MTGSRGRFVYDCSLQTRPFVLYGKAKLPEFYLQEEKFGEDYCGDGVKHTGNSQIAYHRYSERSVILAPAQAAIKNPRKVLHERLKKHK